MNKIIAGVFVIWFSCGLGFAQARNNSTRAQPLAAPPTRPPVPVRVPPPVTDGYVIAPEDVLAISVWKEPELATRVTVRSDGMIGVPLVNDVVAAGLTTAQLTQRLTESFSRFLSEPVVSVNPVEIHSQVVYVFGSVAKQGEFILGRPLTIMELLARAGGFTDYAKVNEIQVIRTQRDVTTNQNVTTVYHFNYKEFVESKNLTKNMLLQSGDFIIVP